ncbi:MAG: DUF2497 domain-containing protein [Acetobacter fabarum]|jgi:cell pole-organizing protein PopZ|uniref:DUF2497 domain-containing protein n=1 Tax=Acetobacter fabarum TaxID=483199 RepID=UPI00242B1A68|nr:DUF2497 domain-containing protein [Acetobacter fabarum]MCH4026645.1 DUF2497 domain-containing protein [Acetobacter fabarum]MCH4085494.1 DUF2497 domain-containing protein [Acetobacter fabarum]MCH4126962.1 DUF2497 domain-containing protein [Acetobacter fabarum]MCH4137263.1 DUF2497 domain-containing protein [Acetobacter fabarum]MCH4140173.1 DUF2497 domain-containing protein [Acetobacter fabarum]
MVSPQDSSEETGKSVADTLSSIRQVLHDEHLSATAEHAPEPQDEQDDDVLVLSPSMMDSAQQGEKEAPAAPTRTTDTAQAAGKADLVQPRTVDHDEVLSVTDLRQIELNKKAEHTMSGPLPIPLNDETVSDTANSFAVLQKSLQEKYLREHEERKVAVTHEGSLTVEDIVRQEVRVFLKKWLDAHLASIVQAAVRKEVERLTQRGL